MRVQSPTLIRTAPHTAGLEPPETWNLFVIHDTQPEEWRGAGGTVNVNEANIHWRESGA